MQTVNIPGAWLESELTTEESTQFVEFAAVSSEIKPEAGEDEIIKRLSPYLNALMHMLYRLNKEKLGLTATDENGVMTADGQQFDIVAYTVDFIINRYDMRKPEEESPKKTRRRHNKALDLISTSNGRQLSITNKKYQYALTPRRNKAAYIEIMDGGLFENLRFTDSGQLKLSPDLEKRVKEAKKGPLQDVQGFSVSLLQQVFTAVFRAQKSVTPDTITVYLPKFCEEMGIDIQSGKANDLLTKLKVFENCMGVLGGSKYYSVLTIIAIDNEANTMTFAAPYMTCLLCEIANEPASKIDTKKAHYEIPGYSWLIHSAIVSERNEPAKQIVNRLIAGLLQRGGKPDNALAQNKGKLGASDAVNYSISFKSLIDDVPILKQRISEGATADRNKKLKRAFEGAYKLLKTRTDAYQYFVDLSVSEIIPTMTTLDNELLITHKGINAAFKQKAP